MATPNTFLNRIRRAVGLPPRGRIRITNWERDERYVPRLPSGAYDFYNINLERVNLSGANLTGANLIGINLEGANLQDAILESASISYANVQGANLEGANLRGTTLRRAILEGAILENAFMLYADLRGANLTGANLRGAYLRGADLEGANLAGAILEGANLEGAYLEGAILEGAILEGANFIGANLEETILEGRQMPAVLPPIPRLYQQETAYEIHNAFDKINKQELITFFETRVENANQINNQLARMNEITFLNAIKENIGHFLSKLTPDELTDIPNKPPGYYPTWIRSWKNIWDTIYSDRLSNILYSFESKKIIVLSLSYVLTRPEQFQKNYVLCYLDEVAFAYNTGSEFDSNFSCSKGFVERFATCLKAGIDAELTTELAEDMKIEYKILRNIIQGGYNADVAKRLISEWQDDNKNIITENGEFRANKYELATQQKNNLIQYLCCELGVNQEELMRNSQVRDTIEYMFEDDNILDNTLGGRRIRRKRTMKKNTKRKQNKKRKSKRRIRR